MQNRIADLVVKRRVSPLVRTGLIGGSILLIVLGGLGLYRRGEAMAGFNARHADRQEQRLRGEVQQLRRQTAVLAQRLAVDRRTREAAGAAYTGLAGALKQSDRHVTQLEEQVGFYRAILGGPAQAGVQIERFRVAADGRYHLVLIQSFAYHRALTAVLHFTVHGRAHGRPSVWSYPAAVDRPLAVHFKYFSDTRGRFVLPAGFVPARVIVSVATNGRSVRRGALWPATS
ncbi:MAG: DUF6776 family protein [Acidiferrobacter sp.]